MFGHTIRIDERYALPFAGHEPWPCEPLQPLGHGFYNTPCRVQIHACLRTAQTASIAPYPCQPRRSTGLDRDQLAPYSFRTLSGSGSPSFLIRPF